MLAAPVSGGAIISAVVPMADGGVVAVGRDGINSGSNPQWAIARFAEDGSLYGGFGIGGWVHLFGTTSVDQAQDAAVDAEGRILVVGDASNGSDFDFVLVRLLPDGSLDGTFGNGGVVMTNLISRGPSRAERSREVAVMGDGRIVVAGEHGNSKSGAWEVAIARYLPDGSLDTDPVDGFGPLSGGSRPGFVIDGTVADAQLSLRGLAIHGDGRIVVGCGTLYEGWILACYLADGTKDGGFGSGGRADLVVPGLSQVRLWDLALQGGDVITGGRAYTGGSGYDIIVARHGGTSGVLDPTFGTLGITLSGIPIEDQGGSLAVDGQGRIVVGGGIYTGDNDFIALRLLADGSLDAGFGTGGISDPGVTGEPGGVMGITIDAQERYVVGGWIQPLGSPTLFALARFLGSGTPPSDPPAAPSGLAATAISSTRIDLSWIDNATDESGFEVDRSPDGSDWSPLVTLGPDVTAHADSGLAANATWYYRVRAVNILGGSDWSNIASATTDLFQATDVTAGADLPVSGTVSGSYLDTQNSGAGYEAIEELQTGGKPSKRRSYLEHKWTFDIPSGGSGATFTVEAWHSPNGEGDDFEFAWSSDDANYTPMLHVTKTSDDQTSQSFALPAGISGTIYVRVVDTDDTQGNSSPDTLFVDHMFIHVQ